jgi:transposase-like protein
MTPEQVGHARTLLTQPDATVSSIARLIGVSRSTIYKYLPEAGPAGGMHAIDAGPAGQGMAPAPSRCACSRYKWREEGRDA